MILLIDNNDGLGPQDYSAWVDADQPPKITRLLNAAASMTVSLVASDATFHVPGGGARVILQRSDGLVLFTGYFEVAPEWQCLGRGQQAAWRYVLHATDDTIALDRNAMPARTSLASRTAGSALATLANDVLPGGLDTSGVQDVGPVNQFQVIPQKAWTAHAQELACMTRATYRVSDGELLFQPVGQQTLTISESDPNFTPAALILEQPDALHNDVTIIGELEPTVYVRDYFLGNGTTLAFYLSHKPFGATVTAAPGYGEPSSQPALWSPVNADEKIFTICEDDYTEAQLSPTLWDVDDPNGSLSLHGGQLCVNGGPATITYVEQMELAAGLLLQHGRFTFAGASSGIVGGLYSGTVSPGNCVAGFNITPAGSNCAIQAMINGSATGPVITTTPGHRYTFATQLVANEAHRVHQTYYSTAHPAGEGRGGDAITATLRIVLSVHDVDPANPATIVAPATLLYDNVVGTSPGFVNYAPISATSLAGSVSFTRMQRTVGTEVRSMVPNGAFRTRLGGGMTDGGECYVSSSGTLEFYAPYPPQANEQIVVAYRGSARALARVQDPVSIAEHEQGNDAGRRVYVRHLKSPLAPTSIDAENAAMALLDDAVQPAWIGEYQAASDFLPAQDVLPGDAIQISAPSRGASFTAVVREVGVSVISPADDRSLYSIKFANDAAQPLALTFEQMTLPGPVSTIYNTGLGSSGQYIDSLTAAQITDVIASEITIDAGVAPPSGGGIEVRWSDGGWGTSDSGNLAGRFTTQTFTLPRLSRVQGYYLRQYDGSLPAKYSRYSALLHVDYPL